ncbi:YbdD/YjiX family protein [Tsukamurella tyrosinosolvens]|uniref:YbdD/YjiX family protein n=1 Tax=Tsukamurella tyrosinosolvens TaxID=57704 RepID=UPI0009ECF3DB|nr:YbdD/YjiX family protein [Tsukamurella tyrosinosolvens]MCA4997034.1 YbdD/YjiX family protein [Tsukamurella tyrosinosolvens]QRY86388.1 YbdD/YjiX family protein [Tsukamurella tyrosinosolvens]WEL94236.1 YbdD/YjiX family protein [Tsukamurella tyrosinosolvens]
MGRTGRDPIIRALKAIRWYVGSVMGDNHYQRYVEHRRATHPGEPVMTEREYWKARHDSSTVQARCC